MAAKPERHPVVEALDIVCSAVVRVVGTILDWKVVVPVVSLLVAGHVGEVALIGSQATMLHDIGIAAREILESQSVTLLGWGLLAVVSSVGGAVVWLQHGRLQQQGAELAELRREIDPHRASSREPEKLIERAKKTEQETLREIEGKTP